MQYSYNIIVDSPCEITADFAKANQLKVLHFTYTEGNGDEGLCGVDDLFVSRTAHEFYEAMRNGAAPQTSQPSQHEFESAFREAIESGIPAVYLAFDSGISGCYEGVEAIFTQIATNGNGPRRNRHDDADGGRGRIDDPCQLLAADLEAIGHGAHHATYR